MSTYVRRRKMVERFRSVEHEIQRLHRLLQRRKNPGPMADFIRQTIDDLEGDRSVLLKQINGGDYVEVA